MELLNMALLVMGKYRKDLYGNPIVSCWVSVDGHFAFIEFRSAEDLEMGFALNQCSIAGRTLKIGRTKHSTVPAVVKRPEEEGERPRVYMVKISNMHVEEVDRTSSQLF
jgi:hypothetical protein